MKYIRVHVVSGAKTRGRVSTLIVWPDEAKPERVEASIWHTPANAAKVLRESGEYDEYPCRDHGSVFVAYI